jgi:hypothetical protein
MECRGRIAERREEAAVLQCNKTEDPLGSLSGQHVLRRWKLCSHSGMTAFPHRGEAPRKLSQ